MKGSDFNTGLECPEEREGIFIPDNPSARFNFYKVRIFSALHLVKQISSEYCTDTLTVESLRKEFAVGVSLNHPGIVRYFKFQDNAVYEEFIDGISLRKMIDSDDERLKNRAFVESMIVQVLEAMDYMHKSGVVHHDLKPENIMITRIGERVKIIDFGAAVNAQNNSTPGFTAAYKAPEEDVDITDCRSDIYQFGVTLSEIKGIKSFRKWKSFINKATALDAAKRFQSAEEALKSVSRKSLTSFFLLSLITCALLLILISVFYIFRVSSLPVSKNDIIKHDTVIVSAVSDPEMLALPNDTVTQLSPGASQYIIEESSTAKDEELKRSIQKELEVKIEDMYQKNIIILFDNPDAFGFSPGSVEQQYAKNDALSKVHNNIIKMTDRYVSKYPELKIFIEQTVAQCIEKNQLHIGLMMLKNSSSGDSQPKYEDWKKTRKSISSD